MKEQIREYILGLGMDVCGFASVDRFGEAPVGFHPRDIFPDCRSAVVLGLALPKGLSKVQPRHIYKHFNYVAPPQVDFAAFKAEK